MGEKIEKVNIIGFTTNMFNVQNTMKNEVIQRTGDLAEETAYRETDVT